MARVQLREEQWSKVEAFLESERGAGRPGSDDRKFIEAVLWWRRTGVPWRDLPSDFGPWKTRRLSAFECLPAPSAKFNTMEVDARVSWSHR